ncbi:MAG TPA: type II toxin-antitoxin system VapC family toxin [Ktedonobacterales bacterium]|nr:type II toxin-antitoxin system VapC family toxin [Ktedonobacterales bacterium]
MALHFLDSSAIVKRYVAETGHAWIVSLCDPAQGHDLHIAQAALVEVVATLCRKAREAAITATERDSLIDDFRRDTATTYVVRPVTTSIYTDAGNLCRTYRLRAYDAVQFAAVLGLRDEARASGAPAPIFVCADTDLLSFAVAEDLTVEDPNTHP